MDVFKHAFSLKFKAMDSESFLLVKGFLLNKLEDAACAVEVLDIFRSLLAEQYVSVEDTITVSIRALSSIKGCHYGVENRLATFKFIHEQFLVLGFVQALKDHSETFFEVFFTAVDNEKDPRILMLVFNLIPKLRALNFADCIEDLFECFFCYFPITFRTLPSDPKLVTAQDLRQALKNAILSFPEFGDLAVPLLVEKLSTVQNSSKVDVFDVLSAGSQVFAKEAYAQIQYQLEVVTFSEIIQTSEDAISAAGLSLVRSLCPILAEGWSSKFIGEALSAVKLESPSISFRAAPILESVSSSSEDCFTRALNACFSDLCSFALDNDNCNRQTLAMNCLVALFSPLRLHPEWISLVSTIDTGRIETILLLPNESALQIQLILFGFLSLGFGESFKTRFIASKIVSNLNARTVLSNELKNCFWLASKNVSSLIPFNQVAIVEFLPTVASSPTSALQCIKLLVANSGPITSINEILEKSNVSQIATDKAVLTELLKLSSLDDSLMLKLLAQVDGTIICALLQDQAMGKALELLMLVAPVSVCTNIPCLDDCTSELMAIVSNKCPNLSSFAQNTPLLRMAMIRGALMRGDSSAVEALKAEALAADAGVMAAAFSVQYPLKYYRKKPLLGQWLLSNLIDWMQPHIHAAPIQALLLCLLEWVDEAVITNAFGSEICALLVTICLHFSASDTLKPVLYKRLVTLVGFIDKDIIPSLASSLHSNDPLCMFHLIQLLSSMAKSSAPTLTTICKAHRKLVLAALIPALSHEKRAVRQSAGLCRNWWYVLD